MKKNYLFLLLVFLMTNTLFAIENFTNEGSPIKIAYVTVPEKSADEKILEKLTNISDFEITVSDADDNTDYTDYDLVIVSPVPNSGADGVVAVLDIDKPVLMLKPFAFKTGGWGWGTASNSADADMNIVVPEHKLFTGISLTDDILSIYSEVNQNGVSYISKWTESLDGPPDVKLIATPAGVEGGFAIAEMEAGLEISGVTLQQPLLMIGLSEFSTINITENALRLLTNACYYLMGQDIPETSDISSIVNGQFDIIQASDHIKVDTKENAISQLTIYGMRGELICTTNEPIISTRNIPMGIYLLKVTIDNNIIVRKFIKN